MPLQRPGGFSGPQNSDIVAYLLSRGDYPAGRDELSPQRDVLDGITFMAARP